MTRKETRKVSLKNLDLELGNLKIVTTKKPEEYHRVMTGADVDVFIDFRKLWSLTIYLLSKRL